jgi:hypothetical protein
MFQKLFAMVLTAFLAWSLLHALEAPGRDAEKILYAGIRHLRSGEVETARWAFRYVVTRYPFSRAAREASRRLVSMQTNRPGEAEEFLLRVGEEARRWGVLATPSAPYATPYGLGVLAALVSLMVLLAARTRHRLAWFLWTVAAIAAVVYCLGVTMGSLPGIERSGELVSFFEFQGQAMFLIFGLTLLFLWVRALSQPRHASLSI